MASFSLSNTTRARLPRAPFRAMKDAALGPAYELSLNIVSAAKMRELNRRYRGMDAPTDILSFPLSETEGEIYLCLPEARKEAPKFDRPYANFISFLFIHGCAHLKGHDHGNAMERIEARIRRRFAI